MIWLQGGVCFTFWIAYGVIQGRRAMTIRTWALQIPKSRRVAIATAMLVGAIAQVFLVLTLSLQNGGFGNNGMALFVWPLVAASGLLFLHGQTLATAILISSVQQTVTASRLEASSSQAILEIDHHEAPTS